MFWQWTLSCWQHERVQHVGGKALRQKLLLKGALASRFVNGLDAYAGPTRGLRGAYASLRRGAPTSLRNCQVVVVVGVVVVEMMKFLQDRCLPCMRAQSLLDMVKFVKGKLWANGLVLARGPLWINKSTGNLVTSLTQTSNCETLRKGMLLRHSFFHRPGWCKAAPSSMTMVALSLYHFKSKWSKSNPNPRSMSAIRARKLFLECAGRRGKLPRKTLEASSTPCHQRDVVFTRWYSLVTGFFTESFDTEFTLSTSLIRRPGLLANIAMITFHVRNWSLLCNLALTNLPRLFAACTAVVFHLLLEGSLCRRLSWPHRHEIAPRPPWRNIATRRNGKMTLDCWSKRACTCKGVTHNKDYFLTQAAGGGSVCGFLASSRAGADPMVAEAWWCKELAWKN